FLATDFLTAVVFPPTCQRVRNFLSGQAGRDLLVERSVMWAIGRVPLWQRPTERYFPLTRRRICAQGLYTIPGPPIFTSTMRPTCVASSTAVRGVCCRMSLNTSRRAHWDSEWSNPSDLAVDRLQSKIGAYLWESGIRAARLDSRL